MSVDADGYESEMGRGPRSRGGFMSSRLTLRDRSGSVSPSIVIRAGGSTGPDGCAAATISIPVGFVVVVTHGNGDPATGDLTALVNGCHVAIVPAR
jgi:hypothetical protein